MGQIQFCHFLYLGFFRLDYTDTEDNIFYKRMPRSVHCTLELDKGFTYPDLQIKIHIIELISDDMRNIIVTEQDICDNFVILLRQVRTVTLSRNSSATVRVLAQSDFGNEHIGSPYAPSILYFASSLFEVFSV